MLFLFFSISFLDLFFIGLSHSHETIASLMS
jgi:hypothetical protein